MSAGLALVVACGGGTYAGVGDGGLSPEGGTSSGGTSGSSGASSSGSDASPEPDGPKTPVPAMTFAVRKMFLGESDRSFVKSRDAWKAFGRNIDGLVSTSTAAGECRLYTGAPQTVRQDGNNGIDNSWGKEMMKLLDPFTPTASKDMTAAIEAGGRTPMIALDGVSGAFLYAEKAAAAPKWDGTDTRPIAAAWLSGGQASALIVAGGARGDVYDSGILSGTTLLDLSVNGTDMVVPMRSVRIVMRLSADNATATEGVISGVVATSDMTDAIGRTAGRISTELCSGSTIEGIKESVRQASDILHDGTQDPAKTCDGISVGIGFEATRVTLGAVAPAPAPAPDPCAR